MHFNSKKTGMKKIFFIILLFTGKFCFAQNLVNNWSFEDTVACPTATFQLNKSLGWSEFRESPDYFNSCAPLVINGVSVPQNVWGYQNAMSGNAYAGFVAFGIATSNSREILGSSLNQSTSIGQKYFVSFYVSRAANSNGMQWACNNIGMRFSTTSYSVSNPAPVNNFAHIYSSTIITDTINWVKISGSFVADSNYKYVMFGNFFDDSLTSSMQIGPNFGYAYYYIDDIKISTDSNYVNSIQELNLNVQSIYPNLARDWIEIREHGICNVEIYDATGKIIMILKDIMLPQKINVSNFVTGLYCTRIVFKNKLIINKFIKQ